MARKPGGRSLVPELSDHARAHFQRLSAQYSLPMPRYMVTEMKRHVPLRVQLQRYGSQVRWTGDIAPTSVADMWEGNVREVHVISSAMPNELGALAHAIARLTIHAERAVLIANVPVWRTLLAALSTDSRHAEDVKMPSLREPAADGAILNPIVLDLNVAFAQISGALDRWVLKQIDTHLSGYLDSGADPGHRVQFRIAPDLRQAMRRIWQTWRASFDGSPHLLARFLRLILCAVDANDSEGEAQVLVGPLRLKALTRATAVTLAIASGWQAMTPHAARPGNLARNVDGQIHTGHACAADMIDGEPMAISAAKFMWRTDFVVLPMIHKPTEFAMLANVSLGRDADDVPRLTDVDDRANIVLTVDDAFVSAVGAGVEVLTALLKQAQALHLRHLNKAIERAAPA